MNHGYTPDIVVFCFFSYMAKVSGGNCPRPNVELRLYIFSSFVTIHDSRVIDEDDNSQTTDVTQAERQEVMDT